MEKVSLWVLVLELELGLALLVHELVSFGLIRVALRFDLSR
jgi:hypothetical protein